MENTQLAKVSPEEKSVAFVPFGALDAIKLSVSIIKKFIAVPTKSGQLPSDAQCLKFQMLCQAQRLNPFAGDAFLIGYDGKDGPTFSLVTAHQAFLKRAESNSDFDGMQSGVIVATETGALQEIEGDFFENGQEVVGGWAKVFHKHRKYPTYRRLRVERFNKGFGEWSKDAAGMICKCAEADALRSTFPTLCGGLYLESEMNKGAIDVITTSPALPTFSRPAIAAVAESAPIENAANEQPLPPEPSKRRQTHKAAEAGAEQKKSPQAQIESWMDKVGVSFEDFRDWLKTTEMIGDADSYGEVGALPGDVCQGLLMSPGQLAKCSQIFGKK